MSHESQRFERSPIILMEVINLIREVARALVQHVELAGLARLRGNQPVSRRALHAIAATRSSLSRHRGPGFGPNSDTTSL